MSDMPVIDESNSNYVRLPYTLTKGVVATREGLVWDVNTTDSAVEGALLTMAAQSRKDGRFILRWTEAAERLRYQEGKPWCFPYLDDIMCVDSSQKPDPVDAHTLPLHRLAAILCDDAEGFRVLYWCVENLGQSHTV
jgi:hypothetical protein